MDNTSSKIPNLFADDEVMRSIFTISPGLQKVSSKSRHEFFVDPSHSEPNVLRFRVLAHGKSNDSFRQRRCDYAVCS